MREELQNYCRKLAADFFGKEHMARQIASPNYKNIEGAAVFVEEEIQRLSEEKGATDFRVVHTNLADADSFAGVQFDALRQIFHDRNFSREDTQLQWEEITELLTGGGEEEPAKEAAEANGGLLSELLDAVLRDFADREIHLLWILEHYELAGDDKERTGQWEEWNFGSMRMRAVLLSCISYLLLSEKPAELVSDWPTVSPFFNIFDPCLVVEDE